MSEYIKRDDVISAIYPKSYPITYPDDSHGIGLGNADIIDLINSIPSADVQPVVHGKWETEICDDGYGAYNLFVCSLCGSESAKRFNYCRECGARMDGKDNNVTTKECGES